MQNQTKHTSNVSLWRAIVCLLTVTAVLTIGLNFQRYNLPPFFDQAVANPESDTEVAESTPTSDEEPANRQFPVTDELAALVSQQDGSWIAGSQQNLRFTLSGQVGTQATKDVLEKSMRETYGDFAVSELTINPNAQSEEWVPTSSVLIKEFAARMVEGGFAFGDNVLHLVGDIADQPSKDALLAALPTLEQPISINDQLELANLKSPSLTATHEDGRLFMFGLLPNQQILDQITQSAVDLYGLDNVTSNFFVDNTTYAPMALARWEENLVAFFPFDDYKIQIKDGTFTGELRGGVVFEQSSADLTADGQAVLDIFPALINRSNSQVSVIGHADDSGALASNQALSERRAEAVADYLTSGEIAADRITAIGRGHLEPTASNSSEEGRQQNRRVEIVISP